MTDNHQKNIATFIHLFTFSRFFIPLGNFIGPIVLWMANKDKSEFIDAHGKQAINFQISILLYTLALIILMLPFLFFGIAGSLDLLDLSALHNFYIGWGKPPLLFLLLGGLGFLATIGFILEFICVVAASLKARDGKFFKYPLCITFLK